MPSPLVQLLGGLLVALVGLISGYLLKHLDLRKSQRDNQTSIDIAMITATGAERKVITDNLLAQNAALLSELQRMRSDYWQVLHAMLGALNQIPPSLDAATTLARETRNLALSTTPEPGPATGEGRPAR